MASIALHRLCKTYANGHAAVRDLSLDIVDGELLVLVGPSGCGKSTVLRLIAGLETPTSGHIVIGGTDVTNFAPQERDLAMVFQNYALYPHKSVRENLGFGLRVRGMTPEAVSERVVLTAMSLGIEGVLDRMPAQLSGGQRQRVALGRALVRQPRAFLLDEPLSNLDPLLRVETRAELALLHRRLQATMIYVTHDQEEAMTLGTRVAVMNAGRIEQVAAPLEVFERPATPFVARFVGSPSMNFWHGHLTRRGGHAMVTTSAFSIDVNTAALVARGAVRTQGVLRSLETSGGDPVPLLIGIRPHDIRLAPPGAGDADATVEVVEPLGAYTTLHVRLRGASDRLARVVVAAGDTPPVGDQLSLRLDRTRLHVFDPWAAVATP